MKKTWIALLLACCMAVGACAEGTVYTADQDDQSAVDVSGSEKIVITSAVIQKTGGRTPPVSGA